MFTHLFFLILNLLLISSVIDYTAVPFFLHQPRQAFALFLLSYGFFLWFLSSLCVRLQKKIGKETIILIANLVLLLFFSLFYFLIGSHRLILTTFNPFGISVFSLFSLALYFIGLWICHYSIERMKEKPKKALNNAWLSVRFLLPFIIPFLLFTFLNDSSQLTAIHKVLNDLENDHSSFMQMVLFTVFNLLFIILTIILLPPLAVLIWGCPKLSHPSLNSQLDDLCKKASFKHGGFRVWKIMNQTMTAAIVGVLGKLRYILFTEKLLNEVPDRCLTAILAHEIGHSYHKHLFFYPFILMGMVVAVSLAPFLIDFPFFQLGGLEQDSPILSFFSFLIFALTIALYFRFVFGYFSRIFERQADLHIFKLGIPAADMVEALDLLAVSAGNIHAEPNWHHYSIQERIDFINQANQNRSLIQRHNQRVRLSLIAYSIILCLLTALLYYWP